VLSQPSGTRPRTTPSWSRSVAGIGLHVDFQLRVVAIELADRAGQQPRRGRHHRADAHASDLARFQRHQFVAQPGHVGKHELGVARGGAAKTGGPQAARMPFEQRHAQQIFHVLQHLADGWLGQRQRFGRLAQRPAFFDGYQQAQVLHLQAVVQGGDGRDHGRALGGWGVILMRRPLAQGRRAVNLPQGAQRYMALAGLARWDGRQRGAGASGTELAGIAGFKPHARRPR
jgi:hypothetical protein